MRVLILLCLVLGHVVSAQPQLNGVKVNIESLQEGFEVKSIYTINVPDESENIHLKALTFGGAVISHIQIEGFESTTSQGYELTSVNIPLSGPTPNKIILRYQVVPGNKGEIPVFFGDWTSASSDQDFFQVQLNTDAETNLLFPADSKHVVSEGAKVINASLPAAASMIRIEQGSDSGSVWIRRVDQIVIIIFIMIGALIWYNRKRLIYG